MISTFSLFFAKIYFIRIFRVHNVILEVQNILTTVHYYINFGCGMTSVFFFIRTTLIYFIMLLIIVCLSWIVFLCYYLVGHRRMNTLREICAFVLCPSKGKIIFQYNFIFEEIEIFCLVNLHENSTLIKFQLSRHYVQCILEGLNYINTI